MPVAQNTIQVNLTNLTSIPLSIQSVTPDSSTWSTNNGAVAPVIALDFSLVSSGGPSLNLAYTNTSTTTAFTASLILVGDYQNQWQLSLSWAAGGTPSCKLQQFNGTNIQLQSTPVSPTGSYTLANLNPDQGDTAVYQAVFNKATASASAGG